MNAALSTSRLDSLYSGFLSRPHQLFIRSIRQIIVEDHLALVG
jgi:hypothetical protein